MNTKRHIDYVGFELLLYNYPISRKPHTFLALWVLWVMLVPCLPYSSTLKMEAAHLFENWLTFDDFTVLTLQMYTYLLVDYLTTHCYFKGCLLLNKPWQLVCTVTRKCTDHWYSPEESYEGAHWFYGRDPKRDIRYPGQGLSHVLVHSELSHCSCNRNIDGINGNLRLFTDPYSVKWFRSILHAWKAPLSSLSHVDA